ARDSAWRDDRPREAALRSWRAPVCEPRVAMVGVRTDEAAGTAVIDHDLVEEAFAGSAALTALRPALDREGMVFEIEAFDGSMRRQRVDALLAAGAEEQQRRRAVELRIVEARDRRGPHEITAGDHDGIVIGGGDAAHARDVFVELHIH